MADIFLITPPPAPSPTHAVGVRLQHCTATPPPLHPRRLGTCPSSVTGHKCVLLYHKEDSNQLVFSKNFESRHKSGVCPPPALAVALTNTGLA